MNKDITKFDREKWCKNSAGKNGAKFGRKIVAKIGRKLLQRLAKSCENRPKNVAKKAKCDQYLLWILIAVCKLGTNYEIWTWTFANIAKPQPLVGMPQSIGELLRRSGPRVHFGRSGPRGARCSLDVDWSSFTVNEFFTWASKTNNFSRERAKRTIGHS